MFLYINILYIYIYMDNNKERIGTKSKHKKCRTVESQVELEIYKEIKGA